MKNVKLIRTRKADGVEITMYMTQIEAMWEITSSPENGVVWTRARIEFEDEDGNFVMDDCPQGYAPQFFDGDLNMTPKGYG